MVVSPTTTAGSLARGGAVAEQPNLGIFRCRLIALPAMPTEVSWHGRFLYNPYRIKIYPFGIWMQEESTRRLSARRCRPIIAAETAHGAQIPFNDERTAPQGRLAAERNAEACRNEGPAPARAPEGSV